MANLTFLDLMLAEALASGLAREARRSERPPPDNYFLLPQDSDAWRKIREASKKENMVVCIEFTDNDNDNCRRVQGVFLDLAREFDGIPFVRAVISPGCTYNAMRLDLGGVQFTPTILMVFYGDGSVSRAKFEGMKDIADGLNSGRIKGVVKELIERRVKLKMAERVTEGLRQHVFTRLSDQERKIREEYETRLERQMKEKEEEYKKKEEEKARREQEEEHEKDEKLRIAKEKLRKQKEEHLDELLKMDLDSSSIRELKAIMVKMGVSTVGCLSKQDLKEKLFDQVPELRIRRPGYNPKPRSHNTSMSDDGDSVQTIDGVESARLSKDLEQAKSSLSKKDSEIAKLRRQVQTLEKTVREAGKNVRGDSRVRTAGDEGAKIKKLEISLLETRMLYTTRLEDFEIMDIIHDPKTDKDSDSLILRVKCVKKGIPNSDRVYAMKVLTNYFIQQTQTQVRVEYQNEYEVLCQLPAHENIIHMWAFFYERPTPQVIKFFKKVGNESRGMCLFILMEEHPMSMAEQLGILGDNKGPKGTKVVSWLKDLLSGLVYLEEHNVVHRDLKLSNLLMTTSGRVVLSDFGKAIEMEEDSCFKVKHSHGFDIGGNRAHLAPEVLNSKPPRSMLDYSKQPVWAAGVLAYELAGHPSPFSGGVIDQQGYSVDQLPPLQTTHCKNNSFSEALPRELTRLVRSMLQPELDDRPSLQGCLDTINNI